jgi:hypothetical protein
MRPPRTMRDSAHGSGEVTLDVLPQRSDITGKVVQVLCAEVSMELDEFVTHDGELALSGAAKIPIHTRAILR